MKQASLSRAGEVEVRSTKGEGDRVAPKQNLRTEPITLTLAARASRSLPPAAGEVFYLPAHTKCGFSHPGLP
jgi:hypothetical protein